MMDAVTLTSHRALLTKAAPVEKPDFETLTSEEKIAAVELQDIKQGIEQEKLPTNSIRGVLSRSLGRCGS